MRSRFAQTVRFWMPGLMLTLFLLPGLANAQCGAPVNCTIPTQIVVCPSGDIVTYVTIRDAAGIPCVGSVITMTTNAGCLCGGPLTQSSVTNAAGIAAFRPQLGGCCPGNVDFVDQSGVILGSAFFTSSPDLNADCRVDLSDIARFASLYMGGIGRCADLNGDGILNLVDVVILTNHIGH